MITQHEVSRGGGGAKMEFMPTPRFGLNGASARSLGLSVLAFSKVSYGLMPTTIRF